MRRSRGGPFSSTVLASTVLGTKSFHERDRRLALSVVANHKTSGSGSQHSRRITMKHIRGNEDTGQGVMRAGLITGNVGYAFPHAAILASTREGCTSIGAHVHPCCRITGKDIPHA